MLREERILREERPEPKLVLDPGISAIAEDRAAPEISAVVEEDGREEAIPLERKAPLAETAPDEDLEEPSPEPEPVEAADEDTKVCRKREREKPLAAYGSDSRTADGLGRTCSDWKAEASRQAAAVRESRKGPRSTGRERREKGEETKAAKKIREFAPEANAPAEVTQLRPAPPEPEEERSCANGTSCAAVYPDDLVPTPAILDAANPGPLCRRCQRRAGVA